MKQRPLSLAYKSDLIRRVLLIKPVMETWTRQDRLLVRNVQNALDRVNQELRILLHNLAAETDHLIPDITVHLSKADGDAPDLNEYMRAIAPYARDVRACVCLIPIDDAPAEDPRTTFDLSHLVAVRIDPKLQGWAQRDPGSIVTVNTVLEKLPHVIEDIMLDIAMFHCWTYVRDTYGGSQECKAAFSEKKARFALAQHSTRYYGPVRTGALAYFPLAALCRSRFSFDIKRYLDFWVDLLKAEMLPEVADSRGVDPVLHILKYHPKAGQLSERELRQRLNRLRPGTYLLLRTESRPRLTRESLIIENLFSLNKWKSGRLRLVHFDPQQLREYARYYPAISLFKFKVDKGETNE